VSPTIRRAVTAAALALCAFVAGYAVGHRVTFARLMRLVASETQFALSQRVESLALLRTGDTAGAIAGLEHAVDTAALSLPQGKRWSELDPDLRFTLQLAKAYRTRYPPTDPDAELPAFLETVPMPDVRFCSPAIQELLRSSPTTSDGR
jgi:hypothetical protein